MFSFLRCARIQCWVPFVVMDFNLRIYLDGATLFLNFLNFFFEQRKSRQTLSSVMFKLFSSDLFFFPLHFFFLLLSSVLFNDRFVFNFRLEFLELDLWLLDGLIQSFQTWRSLSYFYLILLLRTPALVFCYLRIFFRRAGLNLKPLRSYP